MLFVCFVFRLFFVDGSCFCCVFFVCFVCVFLLFFVLCFVFSACCVFCVFLCQHCYNKNKQTNKKQNQKNKKNKQMRKNKTCQTKSWRKKRKVTNLSNQNCGKTFSPEAETTWFDINRYTTILLRTCLLVKPRTSSSHPPARVSHSMASLLPPKHSTKNTEAEAFCVKHREAEATSC